MKYIDLHLHTIYSDGFYSPRRVVIDSVMQGQEVISITDHDTTSGVKKAVEEANKWGITVIPGVEISTEPYHILGYGFDINNQEFQDLLLKSRIFQEKIAGKRAEKIYATGIPITLEKVKARYPKSRIGKLNVAATMMYDPDCQRFVLGKSLNELLHIYMRKGGVAYDIGEKEELTPKEAIDGIHAAGGIAIIAHPFKEIEDMKDLDRLVEYGLDGLEIQPNYGDQNKPFLEYAKKNGLLITYGSDFHGAVFPNRPLLSRNGNQLDEQTLELLMNYRLL